MKTSAMRAQHLMEPLYLSDRLRNPETPNGILSENFDRYCETLVAFVSGRTDSVGSYGEFLERLS
jgi:hypothetical protein